MATTVSLKALDRRLSSDDFLVDRSHLKHAVWANVCPQFQDMELMLHDIRSQATVMEVMDARRAFAQMPRPSKAPVSIWARLWECVR